MAIKTENLAIVMTDIVGFTEATVHQSRHDIEALLATHNRVLLPIVRRYKGQHIKSIGDALLLVFRSPTDAMLCAMAMQDALYEYNRSTPRDRQIRIRAGASLGEVRVTRHDIIGEPVNLTSRIAGITPPDEIYLSEAMYMAMNKAEVPSQEVGFKELKGIAQPVRIYNIPRFAPPRLVPDALPAEDITDLVYPYGGAHLNERDQDSGLATGWRHLRDVGRRRGFRFALIALLTVPLALWGMQLVQRWTAQRTAPVAARSPEVVVPVTPPAPESPAIPPPAAVSTPEPPVAQPVPEPVKQVEPTPVKKAVVEPARKAETPVPRREAATAPKPAAVARIETDPTVGVTSFSAAKKLHKDEKITTLRHQLLVESIEKARDNELDQAKRDYKDKRLTKDAYKLKVKEIEKRYE
jgi:class 3 adenylate cyclase